VALALIGRLEVADHLRIGVVRRVVGQRQVDLPHVFKTLHLLGHLHVPCDHPLRGPLLTTKTCGLSAITCAGAPENPLTNP
jgi:hypothetical protein